MEISYEPLSLHDSEDGITWLKALEAWSLIYEEKVMVPHPNNHQIAEITTALLLYDLPDSMLNVGKQGVYALMDKRLRTAMMYPDPPAWLVWVLDRSLVLRGLVIRYLFLPRPYAFRKIKVAEHPDPVTGFYHTQDIVAEPWYIKATFAQRWGPLSLWRRLIGKPVPGPAFDSNGYKIEEMGPKPLKNSGKVEQAENESKLLKMDRSGCPFRVL
jgi:hypothetical protein